MPLQPLTFDDFSGCLADHYVAKDVTRASLIENFLVDETRKPIVRDGLFAHTTQLPTAPGSTRPTGLYVGPEPFAHPFVVTGPHGYTISETGAPVEVLGPAFNNFLPTKTDAQFEAAVQWRRQLIACAGITGLLPQMVYCNSYVTPSSSATPAQYTALTLGLPPFTVAPSTVSTGAYSYGYAIFRKYTFTDYIGTQFEFLSTPLLFNVTNSNDPNIASIVLTGVQVLSNTALTNYDVANVQIEVYRTINGGNQFFFAFEVANGNTIVEDNIPDAVIQLNQQIYTAGGALGFDQPPAAAIAVTQTNDYFWFATKTTLYQSVQGNPGACPSSFNAAMDQKIVGLSDILTFPILFCDKSVYRIEGVFDSFGNNGFIPREISQTAGCIANKSIVKIPNGLVWAGNGGFYFTNGYQVTKISKHLDISYTRWSSGQITGEYDPIKNVVIWTVRRFTSRGSAGLAPNDLFVVLQLNFPITEESSFTTIASLNYSFGPNVYPTTVAFSTSLDLISAGAPYNQWYAKTLITDARGYLLWFDPNALTDPLINPAVAPSAFTTATVIYTWASAGLEHGSLGRRKWTPQVSIEIDSNYPCALQLRHRRDDGGPWTGTGGSPSTGAKYAGSPGGGSTGTGGSPEVRQDGPITWGITDCLWLSDPAEHYWDSNSTIEAKRTVPSGIIADMRRQVMITNSYTVIAASDVYGTATVNKAAKTVTLDNVLMSWITDAEGYYITFTSDGYNQTFLVQTRTATVLTVFDPTGALVDGSQKWEIKGFRKFERPRIVALTMYATDYGDTLAPGTAQQGNNSDAP
jgi:hypothetical protein